MAKRQPNDRVRQLSNRRRDVRGRVLSRSESRPSARPDRGGRNAQPTIGTLSTSVHDAFAPVPSGDAPYQTGVLQEPIVVGPDGKLWFGIYNAQNIVRLN
jgi:hypothetical protein